MLVVVVVLQVAVTEAFFFQMPTMSARMRPVMSSSDTGGAEIVFDEVSVRRGPVELLSDVSWRMNPGERWAVVGENGFGKSSFLKVALGLWTASAGAATRRSGARIGYLEQTAVSGSNLTVKEEVMSRMPEGYEDFEKETRAAYVLKGLGFEAATSEKKCSELSGGWQMRVGLARLLLSEPEVCVLDEPSNHLDESARTWLGNTLSTFEGALLIASHDESLLKASVNNIAEIVGPSPTPSKGRTLDLYKGCSYDKWLVERKERAKRWVATFEKQKAKEKELEDFVNRFGAKASKAKSAKDRMKKLEKLRSTMLPPPPSDITTLAASEDDMTSEKKPDDAELSKKKVAAPVSRRGAARFQLPEAKISTGAVPISLFNASIGYSSLSLPIIKGATFEIPKNARIAVRGPNGAGKSTLGKAIAGILPLIEGSRTPDPKLRVGYFSQDLSQELDPEKTALEVAMSQNEDGVLPEKARAVLGALGLTQDAALRKIESLSGGQKARVALASFALGEPKNFYVFDEPSNHMSSDACDALLDALQSYEGTLIVISHDRSFLSRLDPTHVLTVDATGVKLEQRTLSNSDWLISKTSSSSSGGGDKKKKSTNNSISDAERKRRYNAPKLLAQLEVKIANQEADVAALDADLLEAGADVAACLELAKKRDKLQAQLDKYYADYEGLDALINDDTNVVA